MRVRALRQFGQPKDHHNRGDEFEITAQKAAPLLEAGLVEIIAPTVKVVPEPERIVIPKKARKHR